MKHALIIEDDPRIADVLEDRLIQLGYRSFERTWNEDDAVAAAARRTPDLVIVGRSPESDLPIRAARRIWEAHGVPVIMVVDRSRERTTVVPEGVGASGPFAVDNIAEAVVEAEESAVVGIAA